MAPRIWPWEVSLRVTTRRYRRVLIAALTTFAISTSLLGLIVVVRWQGRRALQSDTHSLVVSQVGQQLIRALSSRRGTLTFLRDTLARSNLSPAQLQALGASAVEHTRHLRGIGLIEGHQVALDAARWTIQMQPGRTRVVQTLSWLNLLLMGLSLTAGLGLTIIVWLLAARTWILQRAVARRTAALRRASERLRQMATTDALTGLHNRRFFLDRWEREWHRAKRYHRPLACLMVDVNRFKQVNPVPRFIPFDESSNGTSSRGFPQSASRSWHIPPRPVPTCWNGARVHPVQTRLNGVHTWGFLWYGVNDRLGHQTGDLILQRVAQELKAVLRQSDLLARFGGDEFIVALPETSLAEATVVAEKLRQIRIALPAGPQNGLSPVSLSVGVGRLQEADEQAQQLLEAADASLYAWKRHGDPLVNAEPP